MHCKVLELKNYVDDFSIYKSFIESQIENLCPIYLI